MPGQRPRTNELAAHADTARRLQTMPGVGPLTALAIEAFAPEMSHFRRNFAAWLGLVSRQHPSGAKDRLGRMSRAADIRRLLIIGVMPRLGGLGRRKIPGLVARSPAGEETPNARAIAVANKMARQIWRC
jgi:transposase